MSDETTEEQAAQARHAEPSTAGENGLVFEHYEPNGTSRKDDTGDVEMG